MNEIATIQESLQSEKAKEWTKEKRTTAQERIQYLEKGLNKESKKELTDRNSRAGLKKLEVEFDRILHLEQKDKVIELDKWIDREEKSKQSRIVKTNKPFCESRAKPSHLKTGEVPLVIKIYQTCWMSQHPNFGPSFINWLKK
ncbi:MAG: hypothetical protein NTZ30_10855 [Planctomycetota bacterium]|nr:hypothetical protein [Planctomycetota bacterium]